MWTFDRVLEVFDEFVLREVIFEVNNLMCGKGGIAMNPNCVGIDVRIWEKMLRRGGVGDDGVKKLLGGQTISQRDTVGPFEPYTIGSIARCVGGTAALLTVEEADHVICRILAYLGRIDAGGMVVPAENAPHGHRDAHG